MKILTPKEEIIMNHFWEHGMMSITQLQQLYDDPVPHINTLSTMVKILEDKGFMDHYALSERRFKYYAAVSRQEYRGNRLASVVNKFFGGSYMSTISTLVAEEKISIENLRALVRTVDENTK